MLTVRLLKWHDGHATVYEKPQFMRRLEKDGNIRQNELGNLWTRMTRKSQSAVQAKQLQGWRGSVSGQGTEQEKEKKKEEKVESALSGSRLFLIAQKA